MKRRKVLIGLLLIASLSATMLAGCGDNSSKSTPTASTTVKQDVQKEEVKVDGGTFMMPIPSDITNFNTVVAETKSAEMVLNAMFDPLFVIDRDETRYYLAESYEVSQDGLSITVRLKDNMYWHDGVKITSEDAVFYFERTAIPTLLGTTGLDGKALICEALDELTFKITLPRVSAAYTTRLGNIKLFPKHIYDNDEDFRTSPVNDLGIGSGPYKLVKWTKGTSIELERFDDYYRGKGNFEKVIFKVTPEESTQEIAFMNGELSVMNVSSLVKYQKYEADEKYDTYSLSENRVNYVSFNSNSKKMQDVNLRKAITYALNREEIFEGAFGGEAMGELNNTVYASCNLCYDPNFEGYEYSKEDAEKLFAEAGVKQIKLLYNGAQPFLENIALIIQSQLGQFGIDVEVISRDAQGFNSSFFYTAEGDWDIGLNVYPVSVDPNSIAFMYKLGTILTTNVFTNDEVNDLIIAGDSELDFSKRKDIYTELQELIRDRYMVYPIATSKYCLVTVNNLRGVDAIDKVPVFEDYLKLYFVEN